MPINYRPESLSNVCEYDCFQQYFCLPRTSGKNGWFSLTPLSPSLTEFYLVSSLLRLSHAPPVSPALECNGGSTRQASGILPTLKPRAVPTCFTASPQPGAPISRPWLHLPHEPPPGEIFWLRRSQRMARMPSGGQNGAMADRLLQEAEIISDSFWCH